MSNQGSGPRVFISYAHESAEHAQRVLDLADRLTREGVDCHLDRYEQSPPEGWPQWMRFQVRDARYVLVVCTETYHRRAEGLEVPGRGLGAIWEFGLVTMEVYDSQGRNDKFIPVIFSADDVRFIPDFLRGATRYDLSSDSGYEALYARLTGQRIVTRPPLGQIRPVDPRALSDSPHQQLTPPQRPDAPVSPVPQHPLVLLQSDQDLMFIRAERIQESNGQLSLELIPASGEETAFITGLTGGWNRKKLAIAFGSTAVQALVESVTRTHVPTGEQFSVLARVGENDRGYPMEMATNGHSADQIAELRARRILLNEKPPAEVARWVTPDSMLDMLVSGMQAGLSVKESPLPRLYREFGQDRAYFLEAARLLAVLYLRLSHTVEHVLRLDLSFEGPTNVRVHFEGRRRKVYTNAPAYEITVSGICPLA